MNNPDTPVAPVTPVSTTGDCPARRAMSFSRSLVRRPGVNVLYMIIERFREGDALPVYRRFRERGRLMPDGLAYVTSWVSQDLRLCFQVMEADSEQLVNEWIRHWDDLVDFEVIPVVTSAEAAATVAPLL